MVGGARLRARARSTSPPRASASRARRSSRSCSPTALQRGHRARARCGRRSKRVFNVPGTRGKEKFVVNNFEGNYSGVADARRRA